MPPCTCGCNQNITRRAIQNHLRGRTVPHLVTALVKSCQTFGPTISPPRLNPSKKFRSSRRYFPLSPTLASSKDDEPDVAMSEVDITERGGAIHARNEAAIVLDNAGAERAINAAREDVWSGLHHDDGDADSEHDGDEDGEGRCMGVGAEEGEVDDGYSSSDDGGSGDYDNSKDDYNGLSALDMMGEEFERNSVTKGGPMYSCRISTPAENVVQLEI